METALEATGLTRSFSGIRAVDDVSLSIPAGGVVGLIGANGAGKTTFVNIVTGYLRPDSGTVTCGTRDITGLGPRRIRRLGVSRSFQIPQLFLELTVFENLLLAVRVAGTNRGGFLHPLRPANDARAQAEVDRMIGRFRLEPYRAQPVGEVPGGIRKLLDVAMATVDHPQVLLLDEPTSGVAAKEKFGFMDLVMDALSEERAAVLFVEHDMEIVRRYADRLIVFHEGRVLLDDTPEHVLADADVRRFVTGAKA
ncbi:ABC transporter ATP-binding protein [Paralimibaculum aggregatum]|uniref:ABC transporter ATP-binding protein n=1 Tax=Paralimibaculum aggregatum TaxID=3036245 RepID=A0ABQ6LL58_9RHOB|nr:ABC transporter ATP-binding protein [Limibaculum sp. NKW23]GMG83956.1 ABC transporter ATP-binding protein [Limibaculum sp. NKW23]